MNREAMRAVGAPAESKEQMGGSPNQRPVVGTRRSHRSDLRNGEG